MPKILLVEDDSNLREIYSARLEAEGYTIVSASDGEEALAIAVRERPDLIVSDIMMPRISGFDMIDILRQTPETKDIKVIVMTALSQDEDRQHGKQLGADHYMVKSQVTLDDVVNTVKQTLGEASSDNKPTTEDAAAVDAPASEESDPPTEAVPANPEDDIAQLDKEVHNFVANDPLMNGTKPSASQSNDSSSNLPTEPL